VWKLRESPSGPKRESVFHHGSAAKVILGLVDSSGKRLQGTNKTKVLGRVRPQNRTAGCRSLSGRKGNRASVPKGGNRRSSQEVKGCRVADWGRYTLRSKAQNVGQQYRVLFRGRDVENREERREPFYWRVFTLPHKGRSRLETSRCALVCLLLRGSSERMIPSPNLRGLRHAWGGWA